MGHESNCVIVAAYDAVSQPLGERTGDAVADRSNQVNPQRAEARSQDRYRQDGAAPKVKRVAHRVHQLSIRQYVRPADIQRAADGFRSLQACDEIMEDVADSDRLTLGMHPARRYHDRKSFDEVTQYLERCRAGADNHRRSQNRDRYSR